MYNIICFQNEFWDMRLGYKLTNPFLHIITFLTFNIAVWRFGKLQVIAYAQESFLFSTLICIGIITNYNLQTGITW